MTFPSALPQPRGKVLLSQHSGMLVKTLTKRHRVFFVGVFTLFCLQLQLPPVRSDPIRSDGRGKEEAAARPFSFPWEKEIAGGGRLGSGRVLDITPFYQGSR